MELKNEIPIFRKKELDIDLSESIGCMSYEDMQLTRLYESILDYGLKPSLEQVSALLSYENLALYYAHELVMLLSGSDNHVFSFDAIHDFTMEWHDDNATNCELMVFAALEQVCGEIKTIHKILNHIQEPKQADVEQEKSSCGLAALFG